jgi:copper chaperone CopZ
MSTQNAGDLRGNPPSELFEKLVVRVGKGICNVRINIDLPHYRALVEDGHHDLRLHRQTARKVVVLRRNILDNNGLFPIRCLPTDPATVGYSNVLRGLTGKGPEGQHSLPGHGKVEAHPVVVDNVLSQIVAEILQARTFGSRIREDCVDIGLMSFEFLECHPDSPEVEICPRPVGAGTRTIFHERPPPCNGAADSHALAVPSADYYLWRMENTQAPKKAVLDLEGANCTSCSIAIEHLGRKLDGVEDIFVDRGTSTVQVEYVGETEVLDKIVEFVDRLGYHASIRTTE